MLNVDHVLRMIRPYLNKHNELNWAEFYDLFSGLTKKEQYEVVQITIKYDIDIVEEKEEEIAELARAEVLRTNVPETHDFSKLMGLSNEQLCLLYQNGDKAALEALVEKNKKLIYQVAQKTERQFRKVGLTIDDACTAGLFFLGWFGDILKILNRSFTDNVGNPLRH